jgi:hypothetical protein
MAETGHAKNVENWQKMIAACTGFEGDYKPSNTSIQLGSMTTLHTEVEGLMDGVQTSIVPWKNKVAGSRKYLYWSSSTHDADTLGVQSQRCRRQQG